MKTRREFFKNIAAAGIAVGTVSALAACGGDDSGDGGETGGAGTATGTGNNADNCSDVTIGANHGHGLTVPLADVTAGQEKTYDIKGTSAHTHSVTLTAADFVTLAGGTAVNVTSSNDGHEHAITVTCPTPA